MDTSQTVEQLNEQFNAPGLRFESGPGGLTKAAVETDACRGEVYLQGAHVTGFVPAGHQPVLFASRDAVFQSGKAIRGGVPVCFPWFGDKQTPIHGPVRTRLWHVQDVCAHDDQVTLVLATRFVPFTITHRIVFGPELTMTLRVCNTSASPADFEAALHTYFAVRDVRQVEVHGLEHTDYFDKVDGMARKTQDDQPISFTSETDRLYVDTETACVLSDPGLSRCITVDKTDSRSTVVWNPWVEKAAALGDMGNGEWPEMLCIETANAGPNQITLGANSQHEMTAVITVNKL